LSIKNDVDLISFFESLPAGVCLAEPSGKISYMNSQGRHLLGLAHDDLKQLPLVLPVGQHQVPSPDLDMGPIAVSVIPCRFQGQDWQWWTILPAYELDLEDPDAEQLAYQDELTGLPNLHILKNFVEFTCTQTERYKRSAAILQVEIDDFQDLRDELGSAAGDQLVSECALRLQQTVRSSDVVGRIAPSRFLVLLTELTNDRAKERALEGQMTILQRAERVAERINEDFIRPISLRSLELQVRLSIGLTICPGLAHTCDEMLHQSELALATARREASRKIVSYQIDLEETPSEESVTRGSSNSTAAMLDCYNSSAQRVAVEVRPFKHCVRAGTGFAEGAAAQALLQCDLEAVDYILPIQAQQLLDSNLIQQVSALIAQRQIEPNRLVISIPESSILKNRSRRLTAIKQLQRVGVQILIDAEVDSIISLKLLDAIAPQWFKIERHCMLIDCLIAYCATHDVKLLVSGYFSAPDSPSSCYYQLNSTDSSPRSS
jgi:diguanylate cyclase (GGDEF)-like protein